MPAHLAWPVWRLVLAGVASYAEIEEKWTLSLVMDANDALDLQQRAEGMQAEKVNAENHS